MEAVCLTHSKGEMGSEFEGGSQGQQPSPLLHTKGKTCLYHTAHISQGKQFPFEPND